MGVMIVEGKEQFFWGGGEFGRPIVTMGPLRRALLKLLEEDLLCLCGRLSWLLVVSNCQASNDAEAATCITHRHSLHVRTCQWL